MGDHAKPRPRDRVADAEFHVKSDPQDVETVHVKARQNAPELAY